MLMLKLLIVEDEPLVREGLIRYIEWQEHGVEVIDAVNDGVEATYAIDQNIPDIVLTDIKMPGMDGLELAEWIRNRYPDMFVIFLTGYGEFEYARSALRLQATDFLIKPINDETLYKIIEDIRKRIEKRRKNDEEYIRLQKMLEQSMPVLNVVIPSENLDETAGRIYTFNRNNLIRLVTSNDTESVERWLEEYFGYYKKNAGINVKNLQYIIFELLTILIEAANSEGIPEDNRFNFNIIEELALSGTLDELFNKMSNLYTKVMNDIKVYKNKKSRRIIENIKKYIDENYMKKINLITISEKFYMNTSYLSRLFSKESDLSFIDYLMKARVDKAKELLCDPMLKIYSISEIVGYNNEKYFTKVFKKYEGITPLEYRKKHCIPVK